MRSFIGVTALFAAFTLVSADENSTFTIEPSEVTLTTRASWCTAQTNTCNTLCDSDPVDNSCNPNTLDFGCTCQNGTSPGLQYYTETIDTFVCQQAFTDCINKNVGNATGQSGCTTTIEDKCGTLSPENYTASSTSSATAASGTASSTASSTAASSATSTPSKAAAAPSKTQFVGTGAVAAAMGLLAYLL